MSRSLPSRLKHWVKDHFHHRIDTPDERKQSERYALWMDAGFLRLKWTNEGEIAPGVFRANNPSPERLRSYAARGIKTVVNLRDDIDRAPVKLIAADAPALGMTFVSLPMAPRRAPTREELQALVAQMPTWEKPILIHCKSGADRTGLVAAIWLMEQEGRSLTEARDELSLRYLHLVDSSAGILDRVLDLYADAPAGMDFSTWVDTLYDPDAVTALFEATRPHKTGWETFRDTLKGLYRYGQHREAVWHRSFEGPLLTEDDHRRARFFMNWIDHGILRGFWTNEAEIAPGVIRANHPTEGRFRAHAARGLKTVINLRAEIGQPQYRLEQELCAELGLTLIDVPMWAHSAPEADTILALLDAFDRAERPVLFHCKSGADRTGIAAALFVLDQGKGVAAAREQLSLRFLHLKNGKKGVLDLVIDAYERDTATQPQSLRDWVSTRYDPKAIDAAFAAKRAAKT